MPMRDFVGLQPIEQGLSRASRGIIAGHTSSGVERSQQPRDRQCSTMAENRAITEVGHLKILQGDGRFDLSGFA